MNNMQFFAATVHPSLLLLQCCVFPPANRRDLRKAWWRLVDEVQAAAETAARQAEVHAWKTKGAAVKVRAVVQPVRPTLVCT